MICGMIQALIVPGNIPCNVFRSPISHIQSQWWVYPCVSPCCFPTPLWRMSCQRAAGLAQCTLLDRAVSDWCWTESSASCDWHCTDAVAIACRSEKPYKTMVENYIVSLVSSTSFVQLRLPSNDPAKFEEFQDAITIGDLPQCRGRVFLLGEPAWEPNGRFGESKSWTIMILYIYI